MLPAFAAAFGEPASRQLSGTTQAGIIAANVEPSFDNTTSPFWSKAAPATAVRDWTHPMLAFALVSLTFGVYAFYWLFETWREIKRHDGDEGKNPLGHTLAMLVPVYNLFRIHAHMRTIRELVQSSGGRTTLSAGTAVLVWMMAGVLLRLSDQPHLGWLFLVSAVIQGGLVAWAQAALNQAWYLNDPRAPIRRTHPGTWVVLAVGAVLTIVALGA